MAKFTNQPQILLNDSNGIYIPQLWAAGLIETDCPQLNIDWSDVQTIQAGPDHELYWQAWDDITQSYEATDDQGIKWTLYQNGDLWELPSDYDLPEDWLI